MVGGWVGGKLQRCGGKGFHFRVGGSRELSNGVERMSRDICLENSQRVHLLSLTGHDTQRFTDTDEQRICKESIWQLP